MRFQGASLPLAVEAFKNDSAVLEVVFIAPTELVDLVEAERRASLGTANMRRIPTAPVL